MPDATRAVPDSLVLKGADVIAGGREWRACLPQTVADLVRAWSLTIEGPFLGLSYNYVAPVLQADGNPAVLKLWFPDNEAGFEREAEALRIYDGDAAVRILSIDPGKRALLLEKAEPGTDLWQLPDEDQRIEIAAQTMRRLWRPPPPGHALPPAATWVDKMAQQAPVLARGDFPLDWVSRAREMFDELEASAESVVLHGDLHHANVLAAQRHPWLAIDPHGMTGPPAWEPFQFIFNVLREQQDSPSRRRAISHHIEAFAAALNLDREAIRICGTVRAVLEAFWTLEDHGAGWEQDVALIEDFASGLSRSR